MLSQGPNEPKANACQPRHISNPVSHLVKRGWKGFVALDRTYRFIVFVLIFAVVGTAYLIWAWTFATKMSVGNSDQSIWSGYVNALASYGLVFVTLLTFATVLYGVNIQIKDFQTSIEQLHRAAESQELQLQIVRSRVDPVVSEPQVVPKMWFSFDKKAERSKRLRLTLYCIEISFVNTGGVANEVEIRLEGASYTHPMASRGTDNYSAPHPIGFGDSVGPITFYLNQPVLIGHRKELESHCENRSELGKAVPSGGMVPGDVDDFYPLAMDVNLNALTLIIEYVNHEEIRQRATFSLRWPPIYGPPSFGQPLRLVRTAKDEQAPMSVQLRQLAPDFFGSYAIIKFSMHTDAQTKQYQAFDRIELRLINQGGVCESAVVNLCSPEPPYKPLVAPNHQYEPGGRLDSWNHGQANLNLQWTPEAINAVFEEQYFREAFERATADGTFHTVRPQFRPKENAFFVSIEFTNFQRERIMQIYRPVVLYDYQRYDTKVPLVFVEQFDVVD